MDIVLPLCLTVLVLAISTTILAAFIPFLLWKIKKQEEQIEKLDAALAPVLEFFYAPPESPKRG